MCYASGKVQLPLTETPPELLKGLLIGTDLDLNLFSKFICSFNSCFQMTSIGATQIVNNYASNGQLVNWLLRFFKSQMYKLQTGKHVIIINPNQAPTGEHVRRFKMTFVDEIARIMVGNRTVAEEIVIRRRNNNLGFIADINRSYDVLQYPLIFWKGQDGYFINIKQRYNVESYPYNSSHIILLTDRFLYNHEWLVL
jgi:hypothetical protein